MAFTPEQQQQHRAAFINECRQKAWDARCHADRISSQLDKLVSDYGKLKTDEEKLAGEIKALETALDGHTKDNRGKPKGARFSVIERSLVLDPFCGWGTTAVGGSREFCSFLRKSSARGFSEQALQDVAQAVAAADAFDLRQPSGEQYRV
jgi:hypothetical protein